MDKKLLAFMASYVEARLSQISAPEGPQGKVGPIGEQGIPGETGLTGKRGRVGDQGEKGETGERGEKGEKGDLPNIDPIIDRFTKEFSVWQSNINRSLGSLGGGGSTKILQMDDVEYKRRSNVEEDSILIYNPDRKLFVTTNLSEVLQRLKVDLEVQYDKLVDEDPDNGYTYVGEATPGSTKGQSVWRIKRIYEYGPDGDLDILWADGTADFDKIWDDRASYTYSAD